MLQRATQVDTISDEHISSPPAVSEQDSTSSLPTQAVGHDGGFSNLQMFALAGFVLAVVVIVVRRQRASRKRDDEKSLA